MVHQLLKAYQELFWRNIVTGFTLDAGWSLLSILDGHSIQKYTVAAAATLSLRLKTAHERLRDAFVHIKNLMQTSEHMDPWVTSSTHSSVREEFHQGTPDTHLCMYLRRLDYQDFLRQTIALPMIKENERLLSDPTEALTIENL